MFEWDYFWPIGNKIHKKFFYILKERTHIENQGQTFSRMRGQKFDLLLKSTKIYFLDIL
jgi:hypothetical protein